MRLKGIANCIYGNNSDEDNDDSDGDGDSDSDGICDEDDG